MADNPARSAQRLRRQSGLNFMWQLLIPIAFLCIIALSLVVTAEFEVGAGYINGIQGAITITPAGGSDMGATMNMSSRQMSDNFNLEEIPAQNGATIEAAIASRRYRDVDIEFAPKGATRALCQTFISTVLMSLEPLIVLTVASSTIAAHNGTFNYIGGANIKETREGFCVSGIKARQYETAATVGTFAALAKITG